MHHVCCRCRDVPGCFRPSAIHVCAVFIEMMSVLLKDCVNPQATLVTLTARAAPGSHASRSLPPLSTLGLLLLEPFLDLSSSHADVDFASLGCKRLALTLRLYRLRRHNPRPIHRHQPGRMQRGTMEYRWRGTRWYAEAACRSPFGRRA
jgi:hypothetical protein